MTFDKLWEQISTQNPSLASGKATMSTTSFKKAIELAYETGRKSQTWKDTLGYGGDSLFGDVFGKKP